MVYTLWVAATCDETLFLCAAHNDGIVTAVLQYSMLCKKIIYDTSNVLMKKKTTSQSAKKQEFCIFSLPFVVSVRTIDTIQHQFCGSSVNRISDFLFI